MVLVHFPKDRIQGKTSSGSGISHRRLLTGSLLIALGLGASSIAVDFLNPGESRHQNSQSKLEERLTGVNRPATIGSVNYLDEIPHMRFESIEDIPRLIKYTNRSTFNSPQKYRPVHEAYERAVEAAARLNDKPMQYLALLYQSSILRKAETNIVLPKEESHTSLFGTLKSHSKLGFNFRLYNLAKAYEKYEGAQKIWLEAGGLPANVGYGLNEWGDVPRIDDVHVKMIQTIDEMVPLIADSPEPKYQSRLPVLVAKREGLLVTLPHAYQKQVLASHLSPRLRDIYTGNGKQSKTNVFK